MTRQKIPGTPAGSTVWAEFIRVGAKGKELSKTKMYNTLNKIKSPQKEWKNKSINKNKKRNNKTTKNYSYRDFFTATAMVKVWLTLGN